MLVFFFLVGVSNHKLVISKSINNEMQWKKGKMVSWGHKEIK